MFSKKSRFLICDTSLTEGNCPLSSGRTQYLSVKLFCATRFGLIGKPLSSDVFVGLLTTPLR